MHWFTWLFVIALLATALIRAWLSLRQTSAVKRHRSQVPEAFASQIELAAHQKAADYTIARASVGRWDLLLDTALALVLTLGGGIDAIDALRVTLTPSEVSAIEQAVPASSVAGTRYAAPLMVHLDSER